MNTTRLCIITALVVLSTSTAFAQQTGETTRPDTPGVTASITAQERTDVSRLLHAYHELPERSVFLSASPSARAILRDIATNEKVFWLHRSRALNALGHHWADDETFALIDAAVRSKDTPTTGLHQVMLMHVAHFGARATPSVVMHLGHGDVQVRLSAVEALRRLPQDAVARAALKEARETESVPYVREQIDLALTTLR